MSEQVPPTDEEESKGLLAQAASAGLAMYALLILAFAGAGLLCATGSIFAMLKGTAAPRLGLVSGAEVEAWRLSELRRLELLADNVSPDLYYDSSRGNDGTSGCLVTEKNLLAWSENGLTHHKVELNESKVDLELAGRTRVVRVESDQDSASCAFFLEGDAQRFFDMLQAESRRK